MLAQLKRHSQLNQLETAMLRELHSHTKVSVSRWKSQVSKANSNSSQLNSYLNTISMRMELFTSLALSAKEDFGRIHMLLDKFRRLHPLLVWVALRTLLDAMLSTAALSMNQTHSMESISVLKEDCCQLATHSGTGTLQLIA